MSEKKTPNGKQRRRSGKRSRAVRRVIRRLIVLVALIAAGLFMLRAYIRSTAENAGEAEVYSRAFVTRGAMSETVYGTGTTSARSQPSILAKAHGTLTDLRVSVGDQVNQGDVLAVLINDDLDDAITELEFKLWDLDSAISSAAEDTNVRMIEAPVAGRVKAIYAKAGDDALAVFRRESALALISTDGRMKVELDGLPATSGLSLGDRLRVVGVEEGFEAEGIITDLTRQGTQAIVTINDDTLPMDAPVLVLDTNGQELGEGTLEINKPMAVSSYGGTISAVLVKVGDKVSRRSTIFRLEDSPLTLAMEDLRLQRENAAKELKEAKEQRENLIVLAPCDGVIASLSVKEGDDVSNGTLLGSILEGEDMNLTIAVDELDVVEVEVGQSVVITVDALGDAQLPGTVAKIAPVGTSNGGVTTYDVELTLDATGSGVRSGMNATGEITVASAESTLYVPVEALMTIGNQTYVMVETGAAAAFAATDTEAEGATRLFGDRAGTAGADAANAGAQQTQDEGVVSRVVSVLRIPYDALMGWLYDGVQRAESAQVSGTLMPVELGMQNDEYVEILSGVSEGDIVLYTGDSSASTSSFFGMGGMNINLGGAMGGNMGGARNNNNANRNR